MIFLSPIPPTITPAEVVSPNYDRLDLTLPLLSPPRLAEVNH